KAADQRMQFLDPGDLLRLPDSVEYADVAARRDDDQATVLHIEARCVLVDMLVRDALALQFRRREMRVPSPVATDPVLSPVLHHGVGQGFLDAGALDLPGGEGVAGYHGRVLAQDGRDLLSRQSAPIERAEVGQLTGRPDQPMAENVLAPGV